MAKEFNFGELIKQKREANSLERFQLAVEANIDISHLSRIENGHVQPPAATIVALCNALEISDGEIYRFLGGSAEYPYNKITTSSPSPENVLTRSDVATFRQLLHNDPREMFVMLADLMNLVMVEGQSNFQPEQVAELLSEESPFEIQIKYPTMGILERVDANFENGGALSLLDAGLYVEATREKQGLTMRDVQKQGNIPISGISRIENGQTERIRVEDIMKLDEVLSPGKLFAIFWRAFEFYNDLAQELGGKYKVSQENEYQLVMMLINGFRWLQLRDDKRAEHWLEKLHHLQGQSR